MITRMSCSITSTPQSKPGGQVGDRLRELVALDLVQPRRRLVEEEELRAHRDRPRDLKPPLLAGRQRLCEGVGSVPEAELGERLAGALASIATPNPEPDGADLDVLEHGQIRKRAAALKRPREAGCGTAMRRVVADVDALELDPPGGQGLKAADRVHERGLARSVGADQAVDVADPDLEIDLIERLDPLEVDRDPDRLAAGDGLGSPRLPSRVVRACVGRGYSLFDH